MEAGLKDGEEPSPASDDLPNGEHITFAEYLDEICPYYMLWGMTYNEFWHGDLERLAFYEQKHLLEMEQTNQMLWFLGGYIQSAVGSVLDGKKCKYPKEPHRITPKTKAEEREERRKNNAALRNFFNNIKASIDAKNAARAEQKQGE